MCIIPFWKRDIGKALSSNRKYSRISSSPSINASNLENSNKGSTWIFSLSFPTPIFNNSGVLIWSFFFIVAWISWPIFLLRHSWYHLLLLPLTQLLYFLVAVHCHQLGYDFLSAILCSLSHRCLVYSACSWFCVLVACLMMVSSELCHCIMNLSTCVHSMNQGLRSELRSQSFPIRELSHRVSLTNALKPFEWLSLSKFYSRTCYSV